ncbi:MAG: pyrroline-5-carboxylate reductase [Clostridia bacterium]|nr:pyrroline-5-carboxylate reductase [Clostridia bacterium]
MIGFIGTGNMGGALLTAIAKSGEPVSLSDASKARAAALGQETGALVTDNRTIAEKSDLVFLGVKPQTLPALLSEIAPVLNARTDDFAVVSMAAGTSTDRIKEMCKNNNLPIIRIMPNLPVSVGAGAVLYHAADNVSEKSLDLFLRAMKGAGELYPMEERLIDAGSAVTGCGPAFVALVIDAMADGAVSCGIPRKDALKLAEAMTIGTAKLLLEQEKQPGVLKDEVCSPGGTTICGVRELEAGNIRSAFINAVVAAYEANGKL